jgi:hypothetical protein
VAVVLAASWFCWSQVSGMYTARYEQLRAAENALKKQRDELRKEQRRQRDVEDRIAATLAADSSLSRTNYKNWLLTLVNSVGFENPTVTATNTRPRSASFQALAFKVKARADLEKVSDFLVKFYSLVEHHQIRTIRLSPIPNSKLLDVDLAIEVMAGKGSARVAVQDQPVQDDAQEGLRDMAVAVIERNPFGEANAAPKWDRMAPTEVAAGSPLQLNLVAKDANPLDSLSYELIDGPEGLKVDAKTGAVSWEAGEPGEYEVKVAAADDGAPAQRSETKFTIRVVEPRPAGPAFDHATQAFVVATVMQGEQPEAWVSLRTTGKMLRFKQGEKLTVGSVKGQVDVIGRKDIHLLTDAGRLRVPLGSPLTGGKIVEPVAASVETSVNVSGDASSVTPPSSDKQL